MWISVFSGFASFKLFKSFRVYRGPSLGHLESENCSYKGAQEKKAQLTSPVKSSCMWYSQSSPSQLEEQPEAQLLTLTSLFSTHLPCPGPWHRLCWEALQWNGSGDHSASFLMPPQARLGLGQFVSLPQMHHLPVLLTVLTQLLGNNLVSIQL